MSTYASLLIFFRNVCRVTVAQRIQKVSINNMKSSGSPLRMVVISTLGRTSRTGQSNNLQIVCNIALGREHPAWLPNA